MCKFTFCKIAIMIWFFIRIRLIPRALLKALFLGYICTSLFDCNVQIFFSIYWEQYYVKYICIYLLACWYLRIPALRSFILNTSSIHCILCFLFLLFRKPNVENESNSNLIIMFFVVIWWQTFSLILNIIWPRWLIIAIFIFLCFRLSIESFQREEAHFLIPNLLHCIYTFFFYCRYFGDLCIIYMKLQCILIFLIHIELQWISLLSSVKRGWVYITLDKGFLFLGYTCFNISCARD